MIEKQNYTDYLSIDNGKGLLLCKDDVFILKRYGIDYQNYSNIKDLIFVIGQYMDDGFEEDVEDLEEVLIHLMEIHYYQEVNK